MKNSFKKRTLLLATVLALGAFSGCEGQSATTEDVTVYMPDGAPAIVMAGLMNADTEDDGVIYRVVASSLIASKVTNEDMEKNADLCVLPITAASKLLGKGDKYQLLGLVTQGNLYMIAKDAETTYTAENLSALVGKTVGVLQINEVPGLTFKAVLNKNNVAWQEVKNDGEKAADKVNLLAISGADAVGATEGVDCFVLAEPAVSAQAKKGYSIVGDLQQLYGADEEGKFGYPQAVIVAKSEFAADSGEKAKWTWNFVQTLQESNEWVLQASGEEIVAAVSAHLEDEGYTSTLKAPLLGTEVLSRCGVRFEYAYNAQTRIEDYLTEMIAVNEKAAAIPDAAFYWQGILK